jgi:2'-5' RNA ligase
VQGFPENDQLNQIRNELRKKFRESNLKHSIDQRYSILTAHLTVIRFKQKLDNTNTFINKIDHLKNREFGHSDINELELVANDWYQKKIKLN